MGAARSRQKRAVISTLRVLRLVSFVSVAEHTSEKSMPSSESVIGNWKPRTEMIHLLSIMMVDEATQNSTALTTAARSSRILHPIPYCSFEVRKTLFSTARHSEYLCDTPCRKPHGEEVQ
eukprot:scaffold116099_cov40-Phaeocystis_antarctica.AAC.2